MKLRNLSKSIRRGPWWFLKFTEGLGLIEAGVTKFEDIDWNE
jgi:hypothetical protein